MTLNELIQREGEERLRAQGAESRCARISHETLADLYRERIDFRRRAAFDEAAAALRPVAA